MKKETKELLLMELNSILHNFNRFEKVLVKLFYFFVIHQLNFIDYYYLFSLTKTGKKFFALHRNIDKDKLSSSEKKKLLKISKR